MNRIAVLVLSVFSSVSLLAQESAPDITETNCDSLTESVAEAILPGVPLLVIASGYDCGICRAEAPGFDVMADSLVGRARVWGALHHRFSSTTPTCSQLDGWIGSYGWDNFFVFNDVNNGTDKSWAQGGYTSYTVIDTDQTYLYRGTNRNTALAEFFDAVDSAVTGIEYLEADASTLLYSLDGNLLNITSAKNMTGTLSVTSTTGTLIHFGDMELSEGANQLDLTDVPNGMIVATFVNQEGQRITQKLLNDQ